MQAWARGETPAGLASVMVGPATLPVLARGFVPETGYILMTGHRPLRAGGWAECVVPLAAGVSDAVPLRVARLSNDALFDTAAFFALADQLHDHAAGLLLAIDLPHRNEVANLVTLSSEMLDAVLVRLDAVGTP